MARRVWQELDLKHFPWDIGHRGDYPDRLPHPGQPGHLRVGHPVEPQQAVFLFAFAGQSGPME
jgi:hypothetical protein